MGEESRRDRSKAHTHLLKVSVARGASVWGTLYSWRIILWGEYMTVTSTTKQLPAVLKCTLIDERFLCIVTLMASKCHRMIKRL
jgi:hypothetical protein